MPAAINVSRSASRGQLCGSSLSGYFDEHLIRRSRPSVGCLHPFPISFTNSTEMAFKGRISCIRRRPRDAWVALHATKVTESQNSLANMSDTNHHSSISTFNVLVLSYDHRLLVMFVPRTRMHSTKTCDTDHNARGCSPISSRKGFGNSDTLAHPTGDPHRRASLLVYST